MDKVVNLAILRNPLNWLSIGTMLAFVAMAFLVVYSHATAVAPETATMQKEV